MKRTCRRFSEALEGPAVVRCGPLWSTLSRMSFELSDPCIFAIFAIASQPVKGKRSKKVEKVLGAVIPSLQGQVPFLLFPSFAPPSYHLHRNPLVSITLPALHSAPLPSYLLPMCCEIQEAARPIWPRVSSTPLFYPGLGHCDVLCYGLMGRKQS
jgi:hypothetical protein